MGVDIDSFLKLVDRQVELPFVGKLFAAIDQHGDAQVAGHAEDFFARINQDGLWLPLRLNVDFAGLAYDFDAGVFGIAIRLDLELDRHFEQVEVLFYLTADLVPIPLAVNNVIDLELGHARSTDPLLEEVIQIPAGHI